MSVFENLGLKVRKNRISKLLVSYAKTTKIIIQKLLRWVFRPETGGAKPVVYLCHRFRTKNTTNNSQHICYYFIYYTRRFVSV